jgi:hypothetical protein
MTGILRDREWGRDERPCSAIVSSLRNDFMSRRKAAFILPASRTQRTLRQTYAFAFTRSGRYRACWRENYHAPQLIRRIADGGGRWKR